MRIGIVTSNLFKIPPSKGHAIQSFTSALTESMVQKGHQITLFASGDSETKADLFSIVPKSLDKLFSSDDLKQKRHLIFDTALATEAFSKADSLDLLHINVGTWEDLIFLKKLSAVKTVVTLHDPLRISYLSLLKNQIKEIKDLYLISISNAQRAPLPDLPFAQTIYHGINIQQFEFNQLGGEYAGWVGRFSPEKGIDRAILTADKLAIKLVLAPLVWPWSEAKWNEYRKRLATNRNIETKANLGQQDLETFYQKARVLLFPIQWEEPFGLVLIEAMACGTPVVAFARGSVPEVIKDGKTGFIVNSSKDDVRGDWIVKKIGIEGFCEAVEKIYAMPKHEYQKMRQACREHVEKNFTIEKMVDRYEQLYRDVIKK